MYQKIEQILNSIENDPDLTKKLYEILRDRFATKEEIQKILEEIKESRIEFNKRFQESREEMDKRFESMDKRFESILKEMDKRFDRVDRRFDHLSAGMGLSFEGYNKNVLIHFLECQGLPAKEMKWRVHFTDIYGEVNPENEEFEIDILLEEPLIIVEVTTMVYSLVKVQYFLNKIKFLEKHYQKEAKGYFLAYNFEESIASEARKLLKEAKVRVIITET